MNDASTPSSFPDGAAAEVGEVGFVQWRDFHSTEPFVFECGRTLPGITVRYETYGRLDPDRSNALLICHALSGDHHVAGVHSLHDRKPGWWNAVVGPGKPFDTNRFFVIGSNCLGGCVGSTGPTSTNPATGRPYALDFPLVTIRDMVRAQKLLLDHLGVRELACVVGGSMGGMQALQWVIEYPTFCRRLIALATTARQGPQAIAFNEVGRQAILQDPEFRDGLYPVGGGPRAGLAIARMMAHITYLSDRSLDRKFGRRELERMITQRPSFSAAAAAAGLAEPEPTAEAAAEASESSGGGSFGARFEVESYLHYQGRSFINRFDANTYLYFTRALDLFDIPGSYGSLEKAFSEARAETLVVGFTSDWLFPPEQNREIAEAMLRAGKSCSYAELAMDLGHDSFLVESPELYALFRAFLSRP